MALSLLKTTVSPASGTVTPNALLYGFFEYHVNGALNVNVPTFMTDGQILVVSVSNTSGTSYALNWAYPGYFRVDGVYNEVIDTGLVRCLILFCNGGKAIEIANQSYNP